MTALSSIIERVEAATGPDREIDAEVEALSCGWYPSHLCHDATRRSYSVGYLHEDDDGSNLCKGGKHAPEYTASLDAVVQLVERELPDELWMISSKDPTLRPQATLTYRSADAQRVQTAHAKTPALALLLACLRALQSKVTNG